MKYKYSVNECYYCGVTPAFITIEHKTTDNEIFICVDHLKSEYDTDKIEQSGHVYELEQLEGMQLALQEEEFRYKYGG